MMNASFKVDFIITVISKDYLWELENTTWPSHTPTVGMVVNVVGSNLNNNDYLTKCIKWAAGKKL